MLPQGTRPAFLHNIGDSRLGKSRSGKSAEPHAPPLDQWQRQRQRLRWMRFTCHQWSHER